MDMENGWTKRVTKHLSQSEEKKRPITEVEHANHYTTVPNAIYRINVMTNKCELLSVPEIKYQIIHVAPVGRSTVPATFP